MLKKPLPSRAGRVLGVVLAAACSFGGAYAAWASQSPQTEASELSQGVRYDANLKLKIGSGPERFMRLVVPADKSFRLAGSANGNVLLGRIAGPAQSDDRVPDADAWEAEFIARPGSGDAIELAGTISHNGKVVASPLVTTTPGRTATIMAGEPGSSESWRLEATLALHEKTDADAISYRRVRLPIYPASAFDNKVEGIVYVAATIDADGRVTSATVDRVEPSIATVLGAVATAAVKNWEFNVPAAGGHAIVPLRFTVDNPDAIEPSAMPADALHIIDVVGRPAR